MLSDLKTYMIEKQISQSVIEMVFKTYWEDISDFQAYIFLSKLIALESCTDTAFECAHEEWKKQNGVSDV